jgi:hypothetical protein
MVPTLSTRSDRVALFLEPSLETSFPDIVMCVYDPHRFAEWTSERATLKVGDLKILHHLHVVAKTDTLKAAAQLGIEQQRLVRTFEKLYAAGLARRVGTSWAPVSLKQAFGIKRLIAVEAKIDNWTSAFRQACTNKWFASETYVLTPVIRPSVRTVKRAEMLGVGIYSYGESEVTEIYRSPRHGLPSCYASWLFNEWIGRGLAEPLKWGENEHASA